MIECVRKRTTPLVAVGLALIPGLFGFLGLGHLYIRRIRRGVALFALGVIISILTWGLLVFYGVIMYIGMMLGFSGLLLLLKAIIEGTIPIKVLLIPIATGITYLILLIWQTYDVYQLSRSV